MRHRPGYGLHRHPSFAQDGGILLTSRDPLLADPWRPVIEHFIATMPERYLQAFGRISIYQQARIANARGRRAIHVGRISVASEYPGICFVAGDRLEVLAAIACTLAVAGQSVARADIFTRRTARGELEVVAPFWTRSIDENCPAIDHTLDLRDLEAHLAAIILRDWKTHCTSLISRLPPVPTSSHREVSVRLRPMRPGLRMMLELEMLDYPGLLARLASALVMEEVRVLDARIRTHGRTAHDYFEIVNANGGAIEESRLQRIRSSAVAALRGETSS